MHIRCLLFEGRWVCEGDGLQQQFLPWSRRLQTRFLGSFCGLVSTGMLLDHVWTLRSFLGY